MKRWRRRNETAIRYFNLAFKVLGIRWRWDEAHDSRVPRSTGDRTRILHPMRNRSDAPAPRGHIAAALYAQSFFTRR
ncbi:MAG: hypothetical protein NZL99_07530 [Burkholderiaceae bacterium]|nr:hypothetical protein [Burkholderiaceae bacterium]MCX7902089.1 hypothetical protein [Burkholderiaceae bacterium]